MNDDERRLAALLKDAVPPAPTTISASQIRARVPANPSQRQHRFGGWLPAVAAACALLLIAGASVLLVRARSSSSRPAHAASAASTLTPSASRSKPAMKSSGSRKQTASGEEVGPWSARALATTGSNSLIIGTDSLYAEAGGQLTRYDPGTGQSTAQVLTDPNASGGLLVTRIALWQPIITSNGLSLRTMDPDSLQVIGTHPVPGSTPPAGTEWTPHLATNANADSIFLGYGPDVYSIDATTGAVKEHVTVTGLVGAVAPGAGQLYIGVNPMDSNTPTLLALDVDHGLAVTTRTSLVGSHVSGLLATSGGLWIAFAGGHADSVRFAAFSDLSNSRVVASGGGGLPTTVTLSGGTVWIGGSAMVACADPATGTIRSQTAVATQEGQPRYLGTIAQVSGHWIASYQSSDDAGIATFEPPAQCE